MESQSEHVRIEANFEVRLTEPSRKSSLGIYDIVEAAPKFTTDEQPPVTITPLWKKPHVIQFNGKKFAYYKVKIEINGELHGISFEKACKDFELFTVFLTLNNVLFTDVSATISSSSHDETGDSDDDDCEPKIKTYDFKADAYLNENVNDLTTTLRSLIF